MTDREVLGKGTGENWHSRKFDGRANNRWCLIYQMSRVIYFLERGGLPPEGLLRKKQVANQQRERAAAMRSFVPKMNLALHGCGSCRNGDSCRRR